MLLRRRVVQINVLGIRERELEDTHEILGPRILADAKPDLSRGDRLPVDALGRNRRRVPRPVGHHLVAHLGLEIFHAAGERLGGDRAAHQVIGRVPIGIERHVIHDAGDQRSRQLGHSDDDFHGIHRNAVFIHEQPLRRGIDEHEPASRRDRPDALEVHDHPRVGRFACSLDTSPLGVADARIDGIDRGDRGNVLLERRSAGRGEQDLVGARALRLQHVIGINHAGRRTLQRLDVEHPGRGQQLLGRGDIRLALARHRLRDGCFNLGRHFGAGTQTIDRSATQDLGQLGDGHRGAAILKPDRFELVLIIKGSDRPCGGQADCLRRRHGNRRLVLGQAGRRRHC